MFSRKLAPTIKKSATKYPIVGIFGPRQSGKTTLVRSTFPTFTYVNLEQLENRQFAHQDPNAFLAKYPNRIIIDEVQRVPTLLSYLQVRVDEKNTAGQYILTGSQNYLLMESVSQSLAGRISLHYLLPLTFDELPTKIRPKNYLDLLFLGTYPRTYNSRLSPQEFYPSYLQTYLERDIRLLKQVADLSSFEKFVTLCAGRIGQLLNLSSLANDAGITHNTAKSWISLLEASFIVFLLKPHHQNFNKRLVKSPKLYFNDPGLAVWLLNIETIDQLSNHYLLGNLFENWIISEYLKYRHNQGKQPNHYFWRDKTGHEIDMLVDKASTLLPVEIKAGQTINSDFFKALQYWQQLTGNQTGRLIYGGKQKQHRKNIHIYGWPWLINCFKSLQ